MGKSDSTVGRCGQVLNGGKSQLLVGQKDKNISKEQKTIKNINLDGMDFSRNMNK